MKYNPEKYEPPFRVGKKQRRAVLDGTGREVLLFHRGDEQMATAYCDYLNNEYWKVKRNTEPFVPKISLD